MSDLTKYILQALYEATGHTRQPVDVGALLRSRWPQLRPEDARVHVSDLATRGLALLRADGAGVITGAGIRHLSSLWAGGAFGAVPAAAAPHVERLHALAQAEAAAETAANSTQPYSVSHMQRIAEERARGKGPGGDDGMGDTDETPVALVQRKSVAPVPLNASTATVDAQIETLRRAIDGLTQQLSAATDVSMEDWSQGLEITAQLDGALDSLRAILQR